MVWYNSCRNRTGGQNIYAASSAGPATFVFTADEYRGGTVTVRRDGLDQTLIPTNISTEFGRSVSFNGDLLAVGSTGSAHFYDFSGSGFSAAFVFTPPVELVSDILGYPGPFDEGLTVSVLN